MFSWHKRFVSNDFMESHFIQRDCSFFNVYFYIGQQNTFQKFYNVEGKSNIELRNSELG